MSPEIRTNRRDPRRVIDLNYCCFSRGRVLLLTVTGACNQRCVHCMRDALPARAEPLDMALLRPSLTRAVRELEPDRIVISGGEPTLVPNLRELIAFISRLGVRPSLCTNATRIDRRLAGAYAAAGLVSATVGIEGVGETHDRFRGSPLGFARALRGMQALAAAGVRVTANVTLHEEIIDEPEAFADVLGRAGLTSISVTVPILQGRMSANRDRAAGIDRVRVDRFAEVLADGVDCQVSLRIPRCDSAGCPSGKTVFAMDRHGNVTDCPDVGSINVAESV